MALTRTSKRTAVGHAVAASKPRPDNPAQPLSSIPYSLYRIEDSHAIEAPGGEGMRRLLPWHPRPAGAWSPPVDKLQ